MSQSERGMEGEYHLFICSQCEAKEELEKYRGSYVCPWCGEGVMQFVEDPESEESR